MFLPLALVGFLALFGFHTVSIDNHCHSGTNKIMTLFNVIGLIQETIVTSVGEAPTETALAEKQASLKEDRLPQMTDENVGADGSVQKVSFILSVGQVQSIFKVFSNFRFRYAYTLSPFSETTSIMFYFNLNLSDF